MGKSALNKQVSNQAENLTGSSTTQNAESSFSNGELGQLQEILFGQQQRSTHEQIANLQTEFGAQIESLSNVLNSRLNQLTETFEKSNEHFESQLQDMRNEQKLAVSTLKTSISSSSSDLHADIEKLKASSGAATEELSAELQKRESELRQELENTKQALQAELHTSSTQLQSDKLDKQNLAKLLGDLSAKLIEPIPPVAK